MKSRETTPERAAWGQRRHRCNGCGTIFNCAFCKHRSDMLAYCTDECKTKHNAPVKLERETTTSPTFERYLKRAGIGK